MNFDERVAVMISESPRSLKAWLKSAFISWIVLGSLVTCLFFIRSGINSDVRLWFGFITLSSVIHMIAYFLIGVPFFIAFWPQDRSKVWKLKFSLPLGALLGFIGMWVIFSIIDSRPLRLDLKSATELLSGSAYGVVTAFVAWKLKIASTPICPK